MAKVGISNEAGAAFRRIVRSIGEGETKEEVYSMAAGGTYGEDLGVVESANARASLMIRMIVMCRSLFRDSCEPCAALVSGALVTDVVKAFLAAHAEVKHVKALQGAAVSLYLAILRAKGVDYAKSLITRVQATLCKECNIVEDAAYVALVHEVLLASEESGGAHGQ